MPAAPGTDLALITGASSGIGLALAQVFAAHGHDLLLVALEADDLARVAGELAKAHGIKVTTVVADLVTPAGVAATLAAIERDKLTVGILVSNAGFACHGPFLQTDLARELAMVDLQCCTLLRLTKALVPGMVERRRGKLLNICSIYSYSPVAFQAVYGASKAFMHSFATALRSELSGTGVTITNVYPGSTRTEFRKRAGIREKKPGGKGLEASVVAEAAYGGLMRGSSSVVPGFLAKFWVFFSTFVPPGAAAGVLRVINRFRLGKQ